MNAEQKMVYDFHEKFGSYIGAGVPGSNLDPEMLEFRIELIREEFEDEFVPAATAGDLVGMVDALADMTYVIYGAAISLGVDLEPIFKEVHRSNMTKVWPDGTVRRREDGKVMKPPTYSKADIAGQLRLQGWEPQEVAVAPV